MYFDRLDIDPGFVTATLLFAGIVEFFAAALFLVAGIRLVKNQPGVAYRTDLAIAVSIAVFLGFAIFDVVVGDRAELLEHSTYVGVLLVSFLAVAAESFFQHLKDLDSRQHDQPPLSTRAELNRLNRHGPERRDQWNAIGLPYPRFSGPLSVRLAGADRKPRPEDRPLS
jgi:hypothetical protein